MHDGLSWTAIGTIAAIVIPLLTWMVWASAKLAVISSQVRRLLTNHLPHIQRQLDQLLAGKGPLCSRHEKQLVDHEKRIREVED